MHQSIKRLWEPNGALCEWVLLCAQISEFLSEKLNQKWWRGLRLQGRHFPFRSWLHRMQLEIAMERNIPAMRVSRDQPQQRVHNLRFAGSVELHSLRMWMCATSVLGQREMPNLPFEFSLWCRKVRVWVQAKLLQQWKDMPIGPTHLEASSRLELYHRASWIISAVDECIRLAISDAVGQWSVLFQIHPAWSPTNPANAD